MHAIDGRGQNMHAEQEHCAVCGAPVRGARLCDCCRESFALCDMEDYCARAERKNRVSAAQTLSKPTVLWYNIPKRQAGRG